MSNADPGSGSGPPDNIINLQETFNQQQAKISALKKLVRDSEHGKNTANAQEKVRSIAQRLTHLKLKASSRSRQTGDKYSTDSEEIQYSGESTSLNVTNENQYESSSHSYQRHQSVPSTPILRARSETPGSEKIQLLRQQMEQNRQKMAEREHNNRDIEEMVTQLKAKFDSTQLSLEKSSELGKSIGDLSLISSHSRNLAKSSSDLSALSTNLDRERIKSLQNKIHVLENKLKEKNLQLNVVDVDELKNTKITELENKILDLEENLKEKQCIIDARTQAVSLMSENLSLKGKNTIELLEETKQEMFKMQKNFIQSENDQKSEIEVLKMEIDEQKSMIANLEEKNQILETARYDLTIKNSELESKILNIDDKNNYSTKLDELNKLNQSLQHRIADLENQKYEIITDDEVALAKQATFEHSDKQIELSERIDDLQNENVQLKEQLNEKLKLIELTKLNDSEILVNYQNLERICNEYTHKIDELNVKINSLEEMLQEKTIEYNVLNVNFTVLQSQLEATRPKMLFSKTTTDDEAEIEITKLKTQLDDSNKGMIKMKLKLKQLQKQIDNYKKSSDLHRENAKLTDDLQLLQQKLIELEEEKGNLQLRLVNEDINVGGSALTGAESSELEDKIKILEQTCQNQTTAINLLEEQKSDMTQIHQDTKLELTTLKERIHDQDQQESVRVISHFDSIELEEKIEKYSDEKKHLETQLKELSETNEEQNLKLLQLTDVKNELSEKLERYISENIELLDRIEKLSLEKASSNESIEIVEGFTQQDKLEIEEYQKLQDKSSQHSSTDINQQQHLTHDDDHHHHLKESDDVGLSDSLIKLRDENSELMHKIELFTNERREVLDKMEMLMAENQQFSTIIDELKSVKGELENKLEKIEIENSELKENGKELQEEIGKLTERLNKSLPIEEEHLQNTVIQEVAARSSRSPTKEKRLTFDDENYKKSLKTLENELEMFKKTKDKNAKLKMTKKLSFEAKNVHDLFINLLKDHRTLTDNCLSLRTEIELLNMKLINLPSEEGMKKDGAAAAVAEEEKENLKIELIKCQNLLKENEIKLNDLENIKDENDECNRKINEQTLLIEHFNQTKSDLNEKLNEYELIIKQKTNELIQLKNEFDTKLQTAQNEIEILKTLVSEQKTQLIETFTEHEHEIAENQVKLNDYENQIKKFTMDLNKMKNDDDNLNEFRLKMEKQDEELNYKQETIDTLNEQIIELYKQMESNTNQLTQRLDELQQTIDSKHEETIQFNEKLKENKILIEKLKAQLKLNQTEIENLKIAAKNSTTTTNTSDDEKILMEKRIKEMEKSINDLDNKNKEQLDKMKKYAANLKKKVAQCNELEEKLQQAQNKPQNSDEQLEIQQLKNEKDNLMIQLTEKENISSVLQQTIRQLEQEIQILRIETTKTSVNLQQSRNDENELKLLQNDFIELKQELNDKNILINQLQISIENYKEEILRKDRGLDLFEDEAEKLHTTVKEQTLLIDNYKYDLNVLNQKILELELLKVEIVKLTNDDKSKNIKIEKCKAILKEKNREIQKLKDRINELEIKQQNADPSTTELENDYKLLKESYAVEVDALKQSIMNVQSAHKTTFDGFQAKIQENCLYIETIELENVQLKEKINKLEDGIRQIDERRMSLEKQANLLGTELEEKTNEFSQNEDVFVQRLAALEDHDENIRKHLIVTQNENTELNENLKEISLQKEELLKKIGSLESHINYLENEKFHEYEKENYAIRQQSDALQIELKKVHTDFEKKLADKHAEIDELELELSAQLQRVETDKKLIQESLEKSTDTNIELQDEIVRLKDTVNNLEQLKTDLERDLGWTKLQNDNLSNDHLELHELRLQLVQLHGEIENLRQQNSNLQLNYDAEINGLKKQLTELDSVNSQVGQNQTDDQVMLQNENKKLREFLVEKEIEIQKLQQSTDELQRLQNKITEVETISSLKDKKMNEMENSIRDIERKYDEKVNEILQLNTEINEIRREQLIKTSNQEIENVVTRAHEHVQSLQQQHQANSQFNLEEFAVIRQQYELDAKTQQQKIETLQYQLENIEMYVDELEIKLKNSQILREESINLLAEKTKTLDEMSKQNNESVESSTSKKSDVNESIEKNIESQIVVPSFDSSIFFGSTDSTTMSMSPFDTPLTSVNIQQVQQVASVPKRDKDEKLSVDINEQLLENQELISKLENEIQTLQTIRADMTMKLNEQSRSIEDLRLANCEYLVRIGQLEERIHIFESAATTTASNVQQPTNVIQPVWSQFPQENLPSFNSAQFFESNTGTLFDQPDFVPNQSTDEIEENINRKPIVEETIVAHKMYLCGPEKPLQHSKEKNLQILFDDQSFGWEAEPPQDSSIEQMVIAKDIAQAQSSNVQVLKDEHERKIQEIQTNLSELELKYKQLTEENGDILRQLTEKSTLLDEYKSSNVDYVNRIAELETFQQQKTIEEEQKIQGFHSYIYELEGKYKQLMDYCDATTKQLDEQNQAIQEIRMSNLEYIEKIAQLEKQQQKQILPTPPSFAGFEPQAIMQQMIIEQPQPPTQQPSAVASFNSSLFFDSPAPSDEFDFSERKPIVEEVMVAKNMYQCGPEEQKKEQETIDIIATNTTETTITEEGWGWGSEDAALEEQHQKLTEQPKLTSISPSLEAKIKFEEYQDKIDELELEKKHLKEEVIALQVKSGKLLKKLKEYKNKNDNMSKEQFKRGPSVESELDLAIQEELNSQVKTLEQKLKELKIENEKQCMEKESLAKRIDVLTSANERMMEMKERQDNDVGRYQYQLKELNTKLQQLEEWGDESSYNQTSSKETSAAAATTSSSSPSKVNIVQLEKHIEELKAEVNDLKVDNEEYQAMLDEEKTNLKLAENKIQQLQSSLSSDKSEQSNEIDQLKSEIEQKSNEIQTLSARIFVLETEIYESVSKIDLLTVESTNIKIHLDKLSEEHSQKIHENNHLSGELTTLIGKNNELSNEIERMRTASLFQGTEFSSGAGTNTSIVGLHQQQQQSVDEYEQKLQIMQAQLQYKDSEIFHLNQKIDDVVKEDQTQSLVQEILTKNQEINLLKTQVQHLENDKIELENNLSLQLTQQLLPLKTEEVNNLKIDITNRDKKIVELENELFNLKEEKSHIESELHILNEQILLNISYEDRMKDGLIELDKKTKQIIELQNQIEQLKMILNGNNVSQQTQIVDDNNVQLDQQWRQYLNERENEFKLLENTLKEEINILKLQKQTNTVIDKSDGQESSSLLTPDSVTVKKMEEALESQEIEIVTLKEQLAIRSAEYASLAARIDPYAERSTSSSMGTIMQPKKIVRSNDQNVGNNDDTVPRGELDLALYMLHQRDMRCEELTLELISLLEERDTLQLKLSNSIRQIEEIRRIPILSEVSDTDSGDVNLTNENTPEKKDVGQNEETSVQQLSREKGAFDLKTKLTELKGVSHARDITTCEDREDRERQRQMTQLQKDITNIPSEAVAHLVGTDFTLSRTSQSPSAVLINWLMGRSTPKEPQLPQS